MIYSTWEGWWLSTNDVTEMFIRMSRFQEILLQQFYCFNSFGYVICGRPRHHRRSQRLLSCHRSRSFRQNSVIESNPIGAAIEKRLLPISRLRFERNESPPFGRKHMLGDRARARSGRLTPVTCNRFAPVTRSRRGGIWRGERVGGCLWFHVFCRISLPERREEPRSEYFFPKQIRYMNQKTTKIST